MFPLRFFGGLPESMHSPEEAGAHWGTQIGRRLWRANHNNFTGVIYGLYQRIIETRDETGI